MREKDGNATGGRESLYVEMAKALNNMFQEESGMQANKRIVKNKIGYMKQQKEKAERYVCIAS